ncbi:peptide ABC transporter substrate-binding protein [Falsirhodobacter sp. 20TX0035]|uniref:peptide ABC transporter substrate-binding protein n=1 Tax=Falsirhodobacter sp. 20TX0035 TaxID=3022019 RepID=UPI00232CE743|nr:peptide ABC transporter substrate-binding protein [Falsirhodobacter sp. 20TX0035]MDB6453094.1 peptide ABC transporter substrate-binding protein [Falsirhodobacter sp. 20TX0035]
MTMRDLLAASALSLVLGAGAVSAEVVMNRGNDTDPATLDPHHTQTVSESRVLKDLFDGLVIQSAKGEAIPGIAESWDLSEDGTVYTFHLRDAKWSNGDPVTAGDFSFAYHRIVDPMTAAGYASNLFAIKNAEAIASGKMPVDQLGVRVIDDKTLEITLNSPTPYFIELLTHQAALPLHQKSVEEFGDQFTRPENFVTNGAYKLESFTPNSQLVMVKNPEYYNADQVTIDRVNWIPFEDRSACMRRFEAGEVQTCTDVPAEQMDYVKANLADSLRIAPYLGTYYLPVKGAEGSPLKDARVRKAISMAIDRDFIAEEVWAGTMLPSYKLVPPGIANYDGDAVTVDYADEDLFDREDDAKALLEEAGVAPGSLTVELRYNTGENHKNTMAAIADMLTNIGINARLNEVEGTTYFNYLREDGPFDMARAGWVGDYNDPQNFLMLYESGVAFNYSRWSNADYDAALDKAATTMDLGERAEILAGAEQTLLDDQAIIPILAYSSRALVAANVEGYEDNLMDAHATRWLSLN